MSRPRIGIQLIIYGERTSDDLAGVLEEVKEAGYEGIESGNLFKTASPERIKELLTRTGLAVAGIHTGYEDVTNEQALRENIAYLKEVGARYLICSGVAKAEGIGAFEEAAPVFDRAGRICHEEGLTFCYHNHDWEFKSFDGVKGIHRLAELTDPQLVKLCIDVYWVTMGGEEPSDFIGRYAERAGYYHFKDGAPGSFTELGRGTVDLRACAQAALKAGVDWIVCEQDRTDRPTRESVAESRRFLRALGFY
jgi:sugar phosphate isomerase/epimerase